MNYDSKEFQDLLARFFEYCEELNRTDPLLSMLAIRARFAEKDFYRHMHDDALRGELVSCLAMSKETEDLIRPFSLLAGYVMPPSCYSHDIPTVLLYITAVHTAVLDVRKADVFLPDKTDYGAAIFLMDGTHGVSVPGLNLDSEGRTTSFRKQSLLNVLPQLRNNPLILTLFLKMMMDFPCDTSTTEGRKNNWARRQALDLVRAGTN